MNAALTLRPATVDDADELARLYARERRFLAPFDPVRPASYFNTAGQRALMAQTAELRAAGLLERFLMVVANEVVGMISVSNIVRGAFQSANVGYFVAERHNGRGYATRAVAGAVEWAFGEVGLHRLEAGTLIDNVASQRVLERNGFTRIGIAPKYLQIAGRWEDHVLFQLVADDPRPALSGL